MSLQRSLSASTQLLCKWATRLGSPMRSWTRFGNWLRHCEGAAVNYLLQKAIAFDKWLNAKLCKGDPRETMSSACYRMERDGHFWGFMRPVIDTLFFFQADHCRKAYEGEGRQLELVRASPDG